ncbi:MAG: response regulator [Bacteroidetes bacterium]|jgi:DNA-binding NtrC family response regulator|nr:response regulator [Bacteroidota bacterium]
MADQPHVLFVDDEQMLHTLFTRLFKRFDIQLTHCMSALQAVDLLEEHAFDLVITDFMMPDMDGVELLAHIRETYPSVRVIMITAHANVQHAVRAMKTGAIDYIPKPFSTDELMERVQRLLEEEEPAAAAPVTAPAHPPSDAADAFIGEHPSIQRLKEMLPLLSQNRAPVFIQGESGTGKEVLARAIHQASHRAEEPFVALNCATLPSELAESHLFGHIKGAFTGAVADMTGAFEKADGGTLLLDEVTEVKQSIQAKLLRALQEREFVKVGSSKPQAVDVRVIATSNRNLQEAMEEGTFREDLYHRLSVFPLTLPPLRDRASDIPKLVTFFISKYAALYGLPEKEVSDELMQDFMSRPWPGNVRELENMVQRGVILSADREVILQEDVVNDFFSDKQPSSTGAADLVRAGKTIEEMEREMILKTLEHTGNNQKEAAKRLGVSARTIRNKLTKYREEGHIPK